MLLGCSILFPISTLGRVDDTGKRSFREHQATNARNKVTRQISAQGATVKAKLFLTVGITLTLSAFAQTNRQTTLVVEPISPTPIFRVNVVSRSVRAVNYEHRSGASKLDFAGTDLMPSASGEAKVNSKRGSIEIDAEFADMQKPTTFGNEYLTYVLWAISPEGRAVNLGEVLVGDNHRSKLRVTT